MQDSAGTTAWAYDALDRLTTATYPNGDAVSYAYDAVGNRTGLTVNGQTTTSTYDAADELTAAGSTTYTYDQNGNELTAATNGVTTTYSYDPLNRLAGIAGPTTASYAYNGDGLRVAKAANGATTSYTWDPTGIGHVLGDGSEYLWGQGLIGQVASNGTATYAHADGLGSVRLLTDASGAVAGREQFDAYGAPRAQSGIQLPFTYTGEQVDAESGLVYLRARYLDPSTGRFLSRDTFPSQPFRPQSLNRYAYAEGSPVTLVDPSGHAAAADDPAAGFSVWAQLPIDRFGGFDGSALTRQDIADFDNRTVALAEQLAAAGYCQAALTGLDWSPQQRDVLEAHRLIDPLPMTTAQRRALLAAAANGDLAAKQPGQFGSGPEADAVADDFPSSPLVPGGGLAAHEAAGGHTLSRHIGKTDAELLQRLQTQPWISGSSSFTDRATAEAAVSGTIGAEQVTIQAWLSGGAKLPLPLRHTFQDFVGRSIPKGSTTAEDVRSVRVILVRDPALVTGYRVQTAFPTQP